MARRGASSVFRKNTPPPTATPARGMSICIFSTPDLPLPPTVVISCSLWQTQGLQISKRKHRPKVKPNLFCAFFAIAKQGRCKTTIKTLVWGWKITFLQSHRYFSVCYIASWKLIIESEPKSVLIICVFIKYSIFTHTQLQFFLIKHLWPILFK